MSTTKWEKNEKNPLCFRNILGRRHKSLDNSIMETPWVTCQTSNNPPFPLVHLVNENHSHLGQFEQP